MSIAAPPKEKVKFPRAEAIAAAKDVLRYVQPLCARIIVAGSLRRGRSEVGDVEIVYIPRWLDSADSNDLFGQMVPTNVMDYALNRLLGMGVLAKRLNVDGVAIWGSSNKLAVHVASGTPFDFFATTQECWANYLVCRTGGKETNTAIAAAAKAKGWKWHPVGDGFEKVDPPEKGKTYTVRSERDVFTFVGLDYLEPEHRR